ncbi:uncharacterized protein N7458_009330 [Penicillium daleae]|uniref:Uncharacterized protein n=1 Tax=Penicillium daleae TaxID=63821 RepID=A0AAD6BXA0_9EURO|nr:uncharacterized protein N7458_009330 [Penicillium daleae]KAJ5438332.1 hypothetical protein N7458_009330 [Penicillium daleae]
MSTVPRPRGVGESREQSSTDYGSTDIIDRQGYPFAVHPGVCALDPASRHIQWNQSVASVALSPVLCEAPHIRMGGGKEDVLGRLETT